jgi:2-dehydro-3-deoxyphosphogluconate aldolase/(4S)-4-hydroxy-2-oxoglutarate aldolase
MSVLSPNEIQEAIVKSGFLPLFNHENADICVNVLKTCYEAGIRVFEYTNRNDNSYETFVRMRKLVDEELPGMLLGIGTIKSAEQAEKFIAAGADFMISPLIFEEINDVRNKHNILWIPGCATPTEIGYAEKWGISLVKIFPARQLGGPSYIKAVRAVFSHMQLMATGGVETTRDDMKDWFHAGVKGIGIGSQLFPQKMIDSGDFDSMREHIKQIVENVAIARGK